MGEKLKAVDNVTKPKEGASNEATLKSQQTKPSEFPKHNISAVKITRFPNPQTVANDGEIEIVRLENENNTLIEEVQSLELQLDLRTKEVVALKIENKDLQVKWNCVSLFFLSIFIGKFYQHIKYDFGM